LEREEEVWGREGGNEEGKVQRARRDERLIVNRREIY
jgi:hypothetical protein